MCSSRFLCDTCCVPAVTGGARAQMAAQVWRCHHIKHSHQPHPKHALVCFLFLTLAHYDFLPWPFFTQHLTGSLSVSSAVLLIIKTKVESEWP